MSRLDIFAWIVLAVLAISTVGVILILGWLPGHIARKRGHPQAHAVQVAGWISLICGFALWPIVFVWAYVDVPSKTGPGAAP
ncbi:DUF3302 domain-containing protein [Aquabacter sp. CN5-332]|uniref:DUF3302 domain-containing protein n=1 Tax=Aquabacter sp. CN5-332 TaxID=3156608 RepID=UPI0032B5F3FE